MLASDHINMALQAIGHLKAAGRTASPSELTRGLQVFANMVDTSNTSRANIFCEVENQFPTVANQQTYSWGTGGTWNAPRPLRVTQANLILPTSPVIRRPMAIWDRSEWAGIILQGIYTWPQGMYLDYAQTALDSITPAANVYLEPIPDGVYQIETYSWQANVAPATLATAIAFPAGYNEFWLYGLAMRLAPMHGLEVPQSVLDSYRRAQQGIARINAAKACPRLATDAALDTSGNGLYNWLTGLRD
jgi:hypothetical protein